MICNGEHLYCDHKLEIGFTKRVRLADVKILVIWKAWKGSRDDTEAIDTKKLNQGGEARAQGGRGRCRTRSLEPQSGVFHVLLKVYAKFSIPTCQFAALTRTGGDYRRCPSFCSTSIVTRLPTLTHQGICPPTPSFPINCTVPRTYRDMPP